MSTARALAYIAGLTLATGVGLVAPAHTPPVPADTPVVLNR